MVGPAVVNVMSETVRAGLMVSVVAVLMGAVGALFRVTRVASMTDEM